MTHARTYDNKAETNADIRTNARYKHGHGRRHIPPKYEADADTNNEGGKKNANTDANVCTNRTTQCTETTTSVMCSEGTEEWGDEMHIL